MSKPFVTLKGNKIYTSELDALAAKPMITDRIAELIYEHNTEIVWNEDIEEWDEVKTPIQYSSCVGCDLCEKIKHQAALSEIISLAKTRKRGIDKFSLGNLGKLYEMGLCLEDMATLLNTSTLRIKEPLQESIDENGAIFTANFLKMWEVPERVFREWTGLGAYEMRAARDKYRLEEAYEEIKEKI